ncbi:hypothetical protein CJJ23_03000 [Mycoplasmopsis agassizii]|uniref:Uncharacterized protein n=1 Tax=Mycoplasmopsis agassizii TaxID=33922 RepID=A0A269TJV7_9BACT|nr:hypothetical protein [Mycoplasmopsis agassizii]PAK21218.1 hypothetical protein CJJ23_03000 [Mycoplasmopsis agassizii]
MAKEKKQNIVKELCDDIKEFAKKNDGLHTPVRNLQEQEDESGYDLKLRGKPKPKISDLGGDGKGGSSDSKYATTDYVDKAVSGLKEEVKVIVKDEIAQSEARMSQKIEDSEVRMSQKIEDSEARMSQKIEDSEARMSQKIEDSEARMSKKIEESNATMMENMSKFATKEYVDNALLESEARNKVFVKETIAPIIVELAETRKENKENKKTLDKILGLIEELNKKK